MRKYTTLLIYDHNKATDSFLNLLHLYTFYKQLITQNCDYMKETPTERTEKRPLKYSKDSRFLCRYIAKMKKTCRTFQFENKDKKLLKGKP